MHPFLKRRLLAALIVVQAAALILVPSIARASGQVSVVLTAERITTVDGRETKSPADKARPGDVIEYRAEYRNAGHGPVKQLAATLPVPNGMEYLPHSASPQVLFASLDGRTFKPVPLTRRVRLEDGREVVREVPPAEYRYLRWSLGTLDVKQSRTVSARVQVSPLRIAAR